MFNHKQVPKIVPQSPPMPVRCALIFQTKDIRIRNKIETALPRRKTERKEGIKWKRMNTTAHNT
jgi:hypothetical protein